MVREKAPGLLADVLWGRVRHLEPLMDLLLLPLGFHVVLVVFAASAPWTPVCLAGLGDLLIVFVHLMAAIATSGGDWRDAMALLHSSEAPADSAFNAELARKHGLDKDGATNSGGRSITFSWRGFASCDRRLKNKILYPRAALRLEI
jgi:hypothetical protein